MASNSRLGCVGIASSGGKLPLEPDFDSVDLALLACNEPPLPGCAPTT